MLNLMRCLQIKKQKQTKKTPRIYKLLEKEIVILKRIANSMEDKINFYGKVKH